LQKLLGHSSIQQTMVYVHLTEGKKVEQMHRCWDDTIITSL
jgi:site-specific recombinase XerD